MPRSRPDLPIVQSVTSVGETLEAEQARRMRRYLITMGIRTACFILAFFAQGWLRWVLMAGAVILPYIAVVLANARKPRLPGRIMPPEVPANRHLTS
ncbi:MAG: DUF3099 domain-containing protein [Phycicoccus sp.]|nr:DUF3099 domain-containing protein [Phycicoccus sp.]